MRTKDSRAVLRGLGRSNAPWLPGELDQTLELPFVVTAVQRALSMATPVIWNSDQGSHFTSLQYLHLLQDAQIKISMDSKGRALDTIFTERLWRTVKYEEVYLHDYTSPKEARHQLSSYFDFYNHTRLHQALDYQTPAEVYSTGIAKFLL
jgi:putative transposase